MTASKMIIPALLTALMAGGGIFATQVNAMPHDGAHGGYGGMRGYMGNCPMMSGSGADLSPEQRQKADAVMKDMQAKLTPLRDKLFVKQQELNALQNATTPDVKAVSQAAAEIASLREQMRKESTALGERLDKELGLAPGTHNFNGYGRGYGRGYGHGGGYGHGYHRGEGRGFHDGWRGHY